MPVFHDDQHGTAIIVGAALINAMKLRGGTLRDSRITINGGGAAGIAVAKLLLELGAGDIVICDTAGAIYEGRPERMDFPKREIACLTNRDLRKGPLAEVIRGSDVFIGLSVGGALTPADREDVAFAVAHGVDFLGLSFINDASDLVLARGVAAAHGPNPPALIAKIERPDALNNVREIAAQA
ncbi:MAG: hypothetical protein C4345_04325, partial [Chloroflexota bacterium]